MMGVSHKHVWHFLVMMNISQTTAERLSSWCTWRIIFFHKFSNMKVFLCCNTGKVPAQKKGTDRQRQRSVVRLAFASLCLVRQSCGTWWCFWAKELLIPPNLLKLIRTTVWPLAVNLSRPSVAGGMRGGKRKRGQRREAKEKANGLLIPIRTIMGISAGDLFISCFFFRGIRVRSEIGNIWCFSEGIQKITLINPPKNEWAAI